MLVVGVAVVGLERRLLMSTPQPGTVTVEAGVKEGLVCHEHDDSEPSMHLIDMSPVERGYSDGIIDSSD